MIPMLPINLPFCVLLQSNTAQQQAIRSDDELCFSERAARRATVLISQVILRTVKSQECERELDAGEDAEEEKMKRAE